MRRSADPLVALAQDTIVAHAEGRPTPPAPELPGDLPDRAGTFVTIHDARGELRGCIGTIVATRTSLAEEIIHNAVQAGFHDPRFSPIQVSELPDLTVSVDVLGEAEPATLADLDAKRYGVIVSRGWQRGLLLPDLEGVDTPDEQVRIALRKAGIPLDEEFELERFEVVRHA